MENQDLDMMFMMLTNIVETNTELLCCGSLADETAREAFNVPEDDEKIVLKGDSFAQEKQFLPAFAEALHGND